MVFRIQKVMHCFKFWCFCPWFAFNFEGCNHSLLELSEIKCAGAKEIYSKTVLLLDFVLPLLYNSESSHFSLHHRTLRLSKWLI